MKIFGILNITPDSFSDGGVHANPVRSAKQMLEQGAFAVDVGAESTRPDATPLTHEEEWERLEPVITACEDIPLSIDTYHPETAQKALKFPQVKYINDVSGLRDDDMARIISKTQAKMIIMHSLTVPADKQIVIQGDPVNELSDWISKTSERLKPFQISAENVILDIGIGFGKTAQQSMELLQNINVLASQTHAIGAKLLVGHSRKSFLSLFTDKPANERDFETAKITAYLAAQNVDFVRVHNVEQNQEAIQIGERSFPTVN